MDTFLKENAEYFEKKAKEAYLEKRYKFVLFFVEQSIQLYLKYNSSKTSNTFLAVFLL